MNTFSTEHVIVWSVIYSVLIALLHYFSCTKTLELKTSHLLAAYLTVNYGKECYILPFMYMRTICTDCNTTSMSVFNGKFISMHNEFKAQYSLRFLVCYFSDLLYYFEFVMFIYQTSLYRSRFITSILSGTRQY